MKKIYKFPVNLGENKVQASESFHPVAFQIQKKTLVIWAECDIDKPNTRHVLTVIGTGHPLPDRSRYVGTLQDGDFVWHAYVGIEQEIK